MFKYDLLHSLKEQRSRTASASPQWITSPVKGTWCLQQSALDKNEAMYKRQVWPSLSSVLPMSPKNVLQRNEMKGKPSHCTDFAPLVQLSSVSISKRGQADYNLCDASTPFVEVLAGLLERFNRRGPQV
jgi:hypothetical protein